MKSLADVFKSYADDSTARMFVLPQRLYDEMQATGDYDMAQFVRTGDIPTSHGQIFTTKHDLPTSADMRATINRKIAAGEPFGASHVGKPFSEGIMARGSLVGDDEYAKGPLKRKHRDEKICGGKEASCLPGKGGQCVACDPHD